MRSSTGLAAGAAVALGMLVAQPLVGSAATVPSIQGSGLSHTASVPTPGVTVPPAAVPSVTTPAAGGLPTATTPAVTTPAVSTPPVSSGAGSSGTQPVSSGTQPVSSAVGGAVRGVGGVTSGALASGQKLASGSTGSSGVTGSGSASGSSRGTGLIQTGSGSSSGSGSSFGSTSSPASGHATGVGHTSGVSGSRGGIASRTHAGSNRRSQGSTAAETRRLRSLVKRLHGCLASVAPAPRRLLSLRAGLTGAPRSAAAAARILHVTLRRERLLEQLALRELREAATGGCAGGAATSPETPGQISPFSGLALSSTPPWFSAGAPAGSSAASIRTAAASGSARPSPRTRRGARHRIAAATQGAGRHVERAGAGSSLPAAAIPVFLAVALALGLVSLPGVRRRLMRAPAAADAGGASAANPGAARPAVAAGESAVAATPQNESEPARAKLWKPHAEVDPEVAGAAAAAYARFAAEQPSGDEPSADRPAAARPTHGPASAWVREHAGQAALLATVLAGGVARAVSRVRSRGPGGR
jgi:hypothetical protein